MCAPEPTDADRAGVWALSVRGRQHRPLGPHRARSHQGLSSAPCEDTELPSRGGVPGVPGLAGGRASAVPPRGVRHGPGRPVRGAGRSGGRGLRAWPGVGSESRYRRAPRKRHGDLVPSVSGVTCGEADVTVALRTCPRLRLRGRGHPRPHPPLRRRQFWARRPPPVQSALPPLCQS